MAKKQRELLLCRYCGIEFSAHRLNPTELKTGQILSLGEFCSALCFQRHKKQDVWCMVVLVGKYQFIASNNGILNLT